MPVIKFKKMAKNKNIFYLNKNEALNNREIASIRNGESEKTSSL